MLPVGFVLPREVIIGLIGGFIVILAATHILCQVVIMVKFFHLKSQQSHWARILPEKKEVDDVMKELRSRQMRLKTIDSVSDSSGISWAEKLNALSNSLLRGIWLRSIEVGETGVLIYGSSVSKHKLEMITIHNFVKKIKENDMLTKGVVLVELDSIKSRRVGELSVADFVIRIQLEQEEVKED